MTDFAHRIFRYLHRETLRAWGGDTRMWVESSPGSGEYDLGLPVAAGAVRGANGTMRGVLNLAEDEVVLHVTADALPNGVEVDDVFLLGEEGPDGMPDRNARRFQVTGVDRAGDYQSHYRIRARRH